MDVALSVFGAGEMVVLVSRGFILDELVVVGQMEKWILAALLSEKLRRSLHI